MKPLNSKVQTGVFVHKYGTTIDKWPKDDYSTRILLEKPIPNGFNTPGYYWMTLAMSMAILFLCTSAFMLTAFLVGKKNKMVTTIFSTACMVLHICLIFMMLGTAGWAGYWEYKIGKQLFGKEVKHS